MAEMFPEDPGMHNMNVPMGMDPNTSTRVTYRDNPSFIQRIRDSLMGIVVGLVLLFVAGGLLFWNEGRAVYMTHSLDEGLKVVHPLQTTNVVFDENNGKLVHLTSPLQVPEVLSDTYYGVHIHAVKIKRVVETFQWVEHEKKREYNEGGKTRVETTYSYSTEWRSELVNSNSFDQIAGHHNPTSSPVASREFVAETVKAGAFHLSKNLISKVNVFTQFIPSKEPPAHNTWIKIHDGMYFHGENPFAPKVGDFRVKILFAGLCEKNNIGQPDVFSIIAKQDGVELKAYPTYSGNDLEMLYLGELSYKEIFEKEHTANIMLTWGMRLVGWLAMFIGFQLMTSLITTLVDWIPLLRDLVAMSVMLMNLCLSISLSVTVIALGWIRYRPLFALGLLACALVPYMFSRKRRSQSEGRFRMD